MPKSRKKKVKHQDFAKIKLKVGKKLPRAANETDASFKSRSIKLKDQFKSDIGGDQSVFINKKKINIKDILSQCQHYNPGNKCEALKKLYEAVSTSPQIIDENLANILENLSELFVDKDPVIRSAAHKNLNVVFSKVPLNNITPFFPMISAYLCCAMTHINEDIQLDSLKILDLILEHYPELLISASSQLLPNLLEQISRQKTGNGMDIQNAKGNRLLAVNPSGMMGSTRWRIDVLGRLKKVLEAVMCVRHSGLKTVVKMKDNDELLWHSAQNYMKLFQYTTWTAHSYIIQSHGVTAASGNDVLSSGQSLKSYLQTLLPLLMQCWIEVAPAQLQSNLSAKALNHGAVLILANVLDIFDLMLSFVSEYSDDYSVSVKWVRETYLKDFTHFFMEYFPFGMEAAEWAVKKSKKAAGDDRKVSGLSLNLSVCQVMIYFMDAKCTKEQWFEAIINFLTGPLKQCKLSTDELKLAMTVFNRLLQTSSDNKTKEMLLKAAFSMYREKHAQSTENQIIFSFFSNNFFANEELRRMEVFKSWLNSIPKLLTAFPGNTDLVTMILSAIKSTTIQKELTFNSNFLDNCKLLKADFVRSLSKLQQQLLAEIMFYIPLKRSHFQELTTLYLTDIISADIQKYLLGILGQRIYNENETEDYISNYLSFTFTLLLGYTRNDSIFICKPTNDVSSGSVCVTYPTDAADTWHKQCGIIQCILEELHASVLTEHVIGDIWISFITEILTTVTSVPVPSAVAILLATSVLVSEIDVPSDVLRLVAYLMCTLWMYVPESLASTRISIDQCNVVFSGDLHSAILHASVHCLREVRKLWTHVIDVIKDDVEKGTDEMINNLLAAFCHICTNTLVKENVQVHYKELKDLMEYIKVNHPSTSSAYSFDSITYYLSVIVK